MAKAHPKCKLITVFATLLSLTSCVSTPSNRFQKVAQSYGLSETTASSRFFDHAIFSNVTEGHSSALHIYIEGDGQPFLHERYINQDPTSAKALMLKLMSQDTSAAKLIGRPCYHARQARNCDESKWWTSHRYGEQVITSMASVINMQNPEGRPIKLVGFSGGGAIAMLLATRVENLEKIVTINANLDIDAWTQAHGYTPLVGSLNPVAHLDKSSRWPQVHLIGTQDKNIPHASWQNKLEHPNIELIRYPKFTHRCCWEAVWSAVLDQHLTSTP